MVKMIFCPNFIMFVLNFAWNFVSNLKTLETIGCFRVNKCIVVSFDTKQKIPAQKH